MVVLKVDARGDSKERCAAHFCFEMQYDILLAHILLEAQRNNVKQRHFSRVELLEQLSVKEPEARQKSSYF